MTSTAPPPGGFVLPPPPGTSHVGTAHAPTTSTSTHPLQTEDSPPPLPRLTLRQEARLRDYLDAQLLAIARAYSKRNQDVPPDPIQSRPTISTTTASSSPSPATLPPRGESEPQLRLPDLPTYLEAWRHRVLAVLCRIPPVAASSVALQVAYLLRATSELLDGVVQGYTLPGHATASRTFATMGARGIVEVALNGHHDATTHGAAPRVPSSRRGIEAPSGVDGGGADAREVHAGNAPTAASQTDDALGAATELLRTLDLLDRVWSAVLRGDAPDFDACWHNVALDLPALRVDAEEGRQGADAIGSAEPHDGYSAGASTSHDEEKRPRRHDSVRVVGSRGARGVGATDRIRLRNVLVQARQRLFEWMREQRGRKVPPRVVVVPAGRRGGGRRTIGQRRGGVEEEEERGRDDGGDELDGREDDGGDAALLPGDLEAVGAGPLDGVYPIEDDEEEESDDEGQDVGHEEQAAAAAVGHSEPKAGRAPAGDNDKSTDEDEDGDALEMEDVDLEEQPPDTVAQGRVAVSPRDASPTSCAPASPSPGRARSDAVDEAAVGDTPEDDVSGAGAGEEARHFARLFASKFDPDEDDDESDEEQSVDEGKPRDGQEEKDVGGEARARKRLRRDGDSDGARSEAEVTRVARRGVGRGSGNGARDDGAGETRGQVGRAPVVEPGAANGVRSIQERRRRDRPGGQPERHDGIAAAPDAPTPTYTREEEEEADAPASSSSSPPPPLPPPRSAEVDMRLDSLFASLFRRTLRTLSAMLDAPVDDRGDGGS